MSFYLSGLFNIKLHILGFPFIDTSPRPTCVIIMLFNQHLDMLHLSAEGIILAKDKFLPNGFKEICEQNKCKKAAFLDFLYQHKQKYCIYVFVQCIYVCVLLT